MAHYALLNENNIVSQIIVGKDEDEDGIDWEEFYSNELGMSCKRTSYNTVAGQHIDGREPFRKNYAGIGYTYDAARDAFIPVKDYPSWLLDEETCTWYAPVPKPEDGKNYFWNEEITNWEEFPEPPAPPARPSSSE